MADFIVRTTTGSKAEIVHLEGDATLNSVEYLREELRAVVRRGPKRVVLDLGGLEFINSLGLGVLLEFRKLLTEAGASLRLAGAAEHIGDIFRRTRLVDLFPMYESPETAAAD